MEISLSCSKEESERSGRRWFYIIEKNIKEFFFGEI